MIIHETSFELDGIDPATAAAMTEQLAPHFAAVPGLVHKVWTRDGDRYGGIYLWRDRASLDAIRGGPLDPATQEAFVDLRVRTIDVLEAPTRITTPGADRAVVRR